MNTDCLNEINPAGGFQAMHNGRCPNAASDPNVHLTSATHHVRVNGSCMNICSVCAVGYGKRKDATIRALDTMEIAA